MVETLKFQNNLCVYGPDGRNCVLRNIHICGKTRSTLKGRGLHHPLSGGDDKENDHFSSRGRRVRKRELQ